MSQLSLRALAQSLAGARRESKGDEGGSELLPASLAGRR